MCVVGCNQESLGLILGFIVLEVAGFLSEGNIYYVVLIWREDRIEDVEFIVIGIQVIIEVVKMGYVNFIRYSIIVWEFEFFFFVIFRGR